MTENDLYNYRIEQVITIGILQKFPRKKQEFDLQRINLCCEYASKGYEVDISLYFDIL